MHHVGRFMLFRSSNTSPPIVRRLRPFRDALPGAVIFTLHCSGQQGVFLDDAYIFYRYATNAAAGLGLVYNVGERVEGYSSVLWTLMLTLGARRSWDLEVLAPLLGLLLGLATLVLLAHVTSILFPRNPLLSVSVPAACALCSGFSYYAVSGMDTLLFMAVLLAAILATASPSRLSWLGISLSALGLVLARVEGFVYAFSLLAVLGAFVVAGREPMRLPRYALAVLIVLVGTAFVFFFRFGYYGRWLPLTISAKSHTTYLLSVAASGDSSAYRALLHTVKVGLGYERFAAALVALPVAMLLVNVIRRTRQSLLVWLLMTCIAVNAVVAVWGEGDWMPYHRFTVMVWPILLLLIAWAASQLLELGTTAVTSRRLTLAVSVAVLGAGLYSFEYWPRINRLTFPPPPPREGRSVFKKEVGLLLRSLEPPAALLTNVAGKTPYFAGPKTYVWDIFGLTDVHNATEGSRWIQWTPQFGRTDFDYSFSRPFDVLVTNNSWDVHELVVYWSQHDVDPRAYSLYASPEWLQHHFYVVAKRSHPAAARLQALCRCAAITLDLDLANSLVRAQVEKH
jgi:arabinofuranosyltransferase